MDGWEVQGLGKFPTVDALKLKGPMVMLTEFLGMMDDGFLRRNPCF